MIEQPIRVVHVLRTGKPVCPQCGQGLESEGGSVNQGGSPEWGPYYWYCEDCDIQWGHA